MDVLESIKTYQAFRQAAVPVATNRDFNLILLHWSIPHLPGIYSRSRGDFDSSGRGNYVDNLALVDQTFRELRQAMETAGVWDSTTVLLSADHWNRLTFLLDRKSDHRVPFLLKLAGQTTRLDYNRRFNTVVTHDLILSILRGELQDPESVARWLNQRRDPNPFAGNETLTQEYELARVQEAKGIATVKVLDPPTLPEKKSYPPRLLLMLLGTILALSCGVAWVFGCRFWEQMGPSNPGKVFAQEIFGTVKAAMPWASRNGFWVRTLSRNAGGHVDPPEVEKEAGK
jgi:hypothetical protein